VVVDLKKYISEIFSLLKIPNFFIPNLIFLKIIQDIAVDLLKIKKEKLWCYCPDESDEFEEDELASLWPCPLSSLDSCFMIPWASCKAFQTSACWVP